MKKLFVTLSLTLALGTLAACGTTTSTPPTPDAMPKDETETTSSTAPFAWTWDGKLMSGLHHVVIKTSKGDIAVELDANLAPKTVTNFMGLASSGYYDNLMFHRVIPTFMIQGGDPSGNGTGGKSLFGDTFEDEIDASNAVYKDGYKAGAIAMANRGPNTNGSQFFIMDQDYPLPPSYTIFGRVTKGQEVVNAIARVDRGENDMPTEKVSFSVQVID